MLVGAENNFVPVSVFEFDPVVQSRHKITCVYEYSSDLVIGALLYLYNFVDDKLVEVVGSADFAEHRCLLWCDETHLQSGKRIEKHA